MKRFLAFVGYIILFVGLITPAVSASAQDTGGDGKYTPYILGDNVFSLLHPTAWTIDTSKGDKNTLVFVSQPALLTQARNIALAPGDVYVTLTLIPLVNVSASRVSVQNTLTGIIDNFRKKSQDSNGIAQFIPTIVVTLPAIKGDAEIARAQYTEVGLFDGSIYMWKISNDVIGIVTANTAIGQFSQIEDDVLILIHSVRFNSTVEALRKGLVPKIEGTP